MRPSRPGALQAALLTALLALAACGGRATADDTAFHQDVVNGSAGAEVTFDATLIGDPIAVGDHEHLEVKAASGELLEVDHNTALAPWVPAHAGDKIVVHGKLYLDPGRTGVHCTHSQTSSGCPDSGWVELAGNYYE